MSRLINAQHINTPEQREDAHGDELTVHLFRDGGVRDQHVDSQRAVERVRDGGQVQVVAQVDAGAQQRDESQAATQQVVEQQPPRAALGHQELLHQRVIEAAVGGVAGHRWREKTEG